MRGSRRRRFVLASCLVPLFTGAPLFAADADALVGIHWWGLKDGTNSYSQGIDPAPAQMLDSRARGAWDVEVVNTHGPAWQQAPFFAPLYRDLYTNKNVSIVTRLEYEYGKTVPSPATVDTTAWAGNVVGSVNQLKDWAHVWQLGNEPNLVGEGQGWANNQITPAGYAGVYKAVRDRVRADARVGPAGPHQVLVAPVSPGGVIPGVRWRDGNQWLGQTIDAIRAAGSPIDGFAVHAYGGGTTVDEALRDFRNGFAQQVAVIDARGVTDVPIHLTEWNRFSTPTGASAPREEALSAEFARSAYRMLDRWNRTPGNHNVVSASWFVYEKSSDNGTGAWDGYSIEYWKDHGNPQGSGGDLYTAYSQAARAGYKAGLAGTRPLPAGVQVIDDFEAGDGRFAQAPSAVGALAPTKVRTADDSYTKTYALRLSVRDDPARQDGWYVRHASAGGSPSGNAPIPLTEGEDGNVGFFLRVLSRTGDTQTPLTTQLVLDSGAGGGADSDAAVARQIIADGDWHFYEWDLDDPADWTAWRGADGAVLSGSDGLLPAAGPVTIDSILFRGGNASVEYYVDGVMRNANGSLAAMLPVPEPGAAAVFLSCGAALILGRRRRPGTPAGAVV